MAQKVLVLKGYPASGKTTYALELMRNNPGVYKRVNKDDIRHIFRENFSKKNEAFVNRVKAFIITEALEDGYSVIVDDTNLKDKDITFVESFLPKGVELEVIDDFMYVPYQELIARNFERSEYEQVPDKVITEMYDRHAPQQATKNDKAETYEVIRNQIKNKYLPHNPDLPNCIIFDIDGTLALKVNRSPFDMSRVGEDLPHEPICRLARRLYAEIHKVNDESKIFLVSGRNEEAREATENWLNTYDIGHDGLFMRAEGDTRKDYIIKEEIYRNNIEGKYNVKYVFDDRQQTVDMWRRIGIPTLQVDKGNF